MRITKVDIPKTPEKNDGLDHIKMDKLGPIVLIAGKNGSGKTRIISKIISTLEMKPSKSSIEEAKRQIQDTPKKIKPYIDGIKNLNLVLTQIAPENKFSTMQRIDSYEKSINSLNKILNQKESILKWGLIETSELAGKYSAIPFVPKKLDLIDCNTYATNQLYQAASNINTVGVDYLPDGTFAKIQVIQNKWHEATHPDFTGSELDRNSANDDYLKLKNLIELFLNTTISRDQKGIARLFGFPLGESKLSDGQKVLLQFCLAIYSQEAELKDLILILDEPENHLHPSVIIQTIDRIQTYNPNGQIWIATHSIPLLAHYNPALIWFVENNTIRHAGKIPEKVLHSLLGDDIEIDKLQDFVSLPAQYATSRYSFECLIEPASVMTESNDLQSFQVRSELLEISNNGKLRVLDYGAGKGRLILNIYDLDQNSQNKLIDNLEYIAYDKFRNDKDLCESSISKVYGSSDNRYFNEYSDLLAIYNKKSFHAIIMCNVFHEIDPKDWLKLFSKEEMILSLLADTGLLLLIEDHQIPIGEKAYQKGFIVLDTPQLKDLFNIKEEDTGFICLKNDGRLKIHQIPARYLLRIDDKSRIEALKSLRARAKENILNIRSKDTSYQNGKLHGFWTQQFANAELSLAELILNN